MVDDVRRDARWLPLSTEGPYAERLIFARVRFPNTVNRELVAGDQSTMWAALRSLVLKHNGWISEDTGQPYPPVSEDAFWNEVTQTDLILMLRAINEEQMRATTAVLPKPEPKLEANGQPVDYDTLARAIVRAMRSHPDAQ